MKNLKQIPQFKSEDEERNFWATHDSIEYVDWPKAQKEDEKKIKKVEKILQNVRKNLWTKSKSF